MKRQSDAILIIEDESVLRRLLATTLRAEGYAVHEADNGKTGYDLALQHRPRLILLDIIMPRMNGMEMLQLLRQDEWGKEAAVILLTNLDDIADLEKAREYGVTDYLVKSDWSLDELARQVKECLEHSQHA